MDKSILELNYPRTFDEEHLVSPEAFPEILANRLNEYVESEDSVTLEMIIGDDVSPEGMSPVCLTILGETDPLEITACEMNSDMVGDLIEAMEDGLRTKNIQFAPFQNYDMRDIYFEAMDFSQINEEQITEHLSKNLQDVEIMGLESVIAVTVYGGAIALNVRKFVKFKADLNSWRKVQAKAQGLNISVPDGPGTSRFEISSRSVTSIPAFYIKEQ